MKRFVVLGLALTAAACIADPLNPLIPPSEQGTGGGCARGSIALEQTIQGQLFSGDCQASVYYETYTFAAEQGKAYFFHMKDVGESLAADSLGDFDTYIEIYGDNETPAGLLAANDDGGGGRFHHNAELFFAAPTSGTFKLRARGWSSNDTGFYALSLRGCDFQRIDGVGSVTASLDTDDCLVHSVPYSSDSGYADMYSVHFTAGETKRIRLTSTTNSFRPVLALGTNWRNEDSYADSWPGMAEITMTARLDGEYLIYAGTDNVFTGGAYELTVEAVTPVPDVRTPPLRVTVAPEKRQR